MKKHEPLSSAKAMIGLLVLGIAFVLFWKFNEYQNYLLNDLSTLRGFVVASIIGMGFLIILMYLASQTVHQAKSTKSSKVSNKKKK